MNSLIIPVYKNELNIPDLLVALQTMHNNLSGNLEVVFVVDGSPDLSYQRLKEALPMQPYPSQLLLLSRNFGSFPAIREGLKAAKGHYFAVMAADLQEPPELATEFFQSLATEPIDVVIGTRDGRDDPFFSQMASSIFWTCYKKFVVADMPVGGIDVFGCNRAFRDQLLQLNESHSSLIAQIFWLGFRRKVVNYQRLKREVGVSAWTLKKKITYMLDSIFSFTDLPIKVIIFLGFLGTILFGLLGVGTIVFKLLGWIPIKGYTALFLSIGFFGAANLLALGLIGSYAWRTYENSKQRPLSIALTAMSFDGINTKDAINL
jgi:glycosyltransferase involved in cell wall biosynthesis